MNYWFWVGVQLVCVIANGVMILYNYANYLKYQKKMFVGLMALAAFWLLWSMVVVCGMLAKLLESGR